MNLYVLTRINEDGSKGADFDEAAGFVVAAGDEDQARDLACDQAGDEGSWVWQDDARSECHLIGHATVPGQEAGVLMRDFHAG